MGSRIDWTLDVSAAMGREVKLVTRDGIIRRGRFGGIKTRAVAFFGREVPVAVEVVVAGDEVPIERVLSVTEIT